MNKKEKKMEQTETNLNKLILENQHILNQILEVAELLTQKIKNITDRQEQLEWDLQKLSVEFEHFVGNRGGQGISLPISELPRIPVIYHMDQIEKSLLIEKDNKTLSRLVKFYNYPFKEIDKIPPGDKAILVLIPSDTGGLNNLRDEDFKIMTTKFVDFILVRIYNNKTNSSVKITKLGIYDTLELQFDSKSKSFSSLVEFRTLEKSITNFLQFKGDGKSYNDKTIYLYYDLIRFSDPDQELLDDFEKNILLGKPYEYLDRKTIQYINREKAVFIVICRVSSEKRNADQLRVITRSQWSYQFKNTDYGYSAAIFLVGKDEVVQDWIKTPDESIPQDIFFLKVDEHQLVIKDEALKKFQDKLTSELNKKF